MPAAYNTIGYVQTEPVTALERSITNIRAEDLPLATTPLALPKLPGGGTQPIQQGILPTSIPDAKQPTQLVHEVQALGARFSQHTVVPG